MAFEVFKPFAKFAKNFAMISNSEKIKLLNGFLASVSPFASEIYSSFTSGINFALKAGEDISIEEFANRAIAIYNPTAKLEFIDFSGGYFDPLFALPTLASAIKRLSGYKASILIVNGLSEIPQGRRNTQRMREQKTQDFDFIVDYISRYKKIFPSIEVFFI